MSQPADELEIEAPDGEDVVDEEYAGSVGAIVPWRLYPEVAVPSSADAKPYLIKLMDAAAAHLEAQAARASRDRVKQLFSSATTEPGPLGLLATFMRGGAVMGVELVSAKATEAMTQRAKASLINLLHQYHRYSAVMKFGDSAARAAYKSPMPRALTGLLGPRAIADIQRLYDEFQRQHTEAEPEMRDAGAARAARNDQREFQDWFTRIRRELMPTGHELERGLGALLEVVVSGVSPAQLFTSGAHYQEAALEVVLQGWLRLLSSLPDANNIKAIIRYLKLVESIKDLERYLKLTERAEAVDEYLKLVEKIKVLERYLKIAKTSKDLATYLKLMERAEALTEYLTERTEALKEVLKVHLKVKDRVDGAHISAGDHAAVKATVSQIYQLISAAEAIIVSDQIEAQALPPLNSITRAITIDRLVAIRRAIDDVIQASYSLPQAADGFNLYNTGTLLSQLHPLARPVSGIASRALALTGSASRLAGIAMLGGVGGYYLPHLKMLFSGSADIGKLLSVPLENLSNTLRDILAAPGEDWPAESLDERIAIAQVIDRVLFAVDSDGSDIEGFDTVFEASLKNVIYNLGVWMAYKGTDTIGPGLNSFLLFQFANNLVPLMTGISSGLDRANVSLAFVISRIVINHVLAHVASKYSRELVATDVAERLAQYLDSHQFKILLRSKVRQGVQDALFNVGEILGFPNLNVLEAEGKKSLVESMVANTTGAIKVFEFGKSFFGRHAAVEVSDAGAIAGAADIEQDDERADSPLAEQATALAVRGNKWVQAALYSPITGRWKPSFTAATTFHADEPPHASSKQLRKLFKDFVSNNSAAYFVTHRRQPWGRVLSGTGIAVAYGTAIAAGQALAWVDSLSVPEKQNAQETTVEAQVATVDSTIFTLNNALRGIIVVGSTVGTVFLLRSQKTYAQAIYHQIQRARTLEQLPTERERKRAEVELDTWTMSSRMESGYSVMGLTLGGALGSGTQLTSALLKARWDEKREQLATHDGDFKLFVERSRKVLGLLKEKSEDCDSYSKLSRYISELEAIHAELATQQAVASGDYQVNANRILQAALTKLMATFSEVKINGIPGKLGAALLRGFAKCPTHERTSAKFAQLITDAIEVVQRPEYTGLAADEALTDEISALKSALTQLRQDMIDGNADVLQWLTDNLDVFEMIGQSAELLSSSDEVSFDVQEREMTRILALFVEKSRRIVASKWMKSEAGIEDDLEVGVAEAREAEEGGAGLPAEESAERLSEEETIRFASRSVLRGSLIELKHLIDKSQTQLRQSLKRLTGAKKLVAEVKESMQQFVEPKSKLFTDSDSLSRALTNLESVFSIMDDDERYQQYIKEQLLVFIPEVLQEEAQMLAKDEFIQFVVTSLLKSVSRKTIQELEKKYQDKEFKSIDEILAISGQMKEALDSLEAGFKEAGLPDLSIEEVHEYLKAYLTKEQDTEAEVGRRSAAALASIAGALAAERASEPCFKRFIGDIHEDYDASEGVTAELSPLKAFISNNIKNRTDGYMFRNIMDRGLPGVEDITAQIKGLLPDDKEGLRRYLPEHRVELIASIQAIVADMPALDDELTIEDALKEVVAFALTKRLEQYLDEVCVSASSLELLEQVNRYVEGVRPYLGEATLVSLQTKIDGADATIKAALEAQDAQARLESERREERARLEREQREKERLQAVRISEVRGLIGELEKISLAFTSHYLPGQAGLMGTVVAHISKLQPMVANKIDSLSKLAADGNEEVLTEVSKFIKLEAGVVIRAEVVRTAIQDKLDGGFKAHLEAQVAAKKREWHASIEAATLKSLDTTMVAIHDDPVWTYYEDAQAVDALPQTSRYARKVMDDVEALMADKSVALNAEATAAREAARKVEQAAAEARAEAHRQASFAEATAYFKKLQEDTEDTWGAKSSGAVGAVAEKEKNKAEIGKAMIAKFKVDMLEAMETKPASSQASGWGLGFWSAASFFTKSSALRLESEEELTIFIEQFKGYLLRKVADSQVARLSIFGPDTGTESRASDASVGGASRSGNFAKMEKELIKAYQERTSGVAAGGPSSALL